MNDQKNVINLLDWAKNVVYLNTNANEATYNKAAAWYGRHLTMVKDAALERDVIDQLDDTANDGPF